ncbi:MAG: lysylphosphatidylglycerol synthase transmembrane domain-containing protein [Bianqueaceae bacterium]
MSSFMEDKKKMWVSTLFLVALMAGTFFFLLRDISWSMLMDTLRKVNPIFIPLGFALMVCFVACEAINIRMILRQVGMRVPFFRCLRYSFVGFYFSSITPSASGGQPAQAYYMNKEGIPVSLSSLTLLVIVAIYQLVMMIYALVCFIWKFEFVSGGVQGIGFLVIFGFIFNSCLFFFIVATIFSKKWLRKGIMACAGFPSPRSYPKRSGKG